MTGLRNISLRTRSILSTCPRRLSRRLFSTTLAKGSYDDTVHNLRIGRHTRVIYQGFTGRVATTNAKDSLDYGTNIVGGVTPGKNGEHLGLPLLPDVRTAKEELKPDATAVFVAAPHCGKAIEDAIEAEIPLIVAVAEHIPLHDILRVASILKTQSKSRLVGANAPGIIAPIGSCRIGFQPLPSFAPGHVGIIAKSGTLSYETVASITRSGLGQSLCIGMGGDIVAGTSIVDGLKVFEHDPETEGIIIVGEVGGTAEEEAAEWIRDYHKRVAKPKPIAALVGGLQAPPGKVMGHAGAWAAKGEHTALEKYNILQSAGARMVDHPENFGGVMKTLLSQSGRNANKPKNDASQRRGYHSARSRPMHPGSRLARHQKQARTLSLQPSQVPAVLEPYIANVEGLSINPEEPPEDSYHLSITIDRSARQPAIQSSPTTSPSSFRSRAKSFPYDHSGPPPEKAILAAIAHMQLDASPPATKAQLAALIRALAKAHVEKEAITLYTTLSIAPSTNLLLHAPTLHLHLDPSVPKSTPRQRDLHADITVATPSQTPEEAEAGEHGIVFHSLNGSDPRANIGTLVNGAGLAMNTVDALARQHGGVATNFLDTGGKATADTVKKSFELILRDARVKVIFVNIFGGLTDGGMIAEGVLLAFKEVDMRGLPVVVRIRGTNEEVGQRIIAESGLALEAFDGFAEAADRVVELANQ